jgi:hypothetical protein
MPDVTKITQIPDPDWRRINLGMNLAKRHYPNVIGEVIADELDSWGHNGYRFGGKQLIDRLLTHLEKVAYAAEHPVQAGEDIGVVTARQTSGIVAGPAVVHRAEVEG